MTKNVAIALTGLSLLAAAAGLLYVQQRAAPLPVASTAGAGAAESALATQTTLQPFSKGGLQGYKNPDGKVVIEARFLRAENFSQGRAVVWVDTERGVRAGYIDTRGRYVVEPKYTAAFAYDSSRVAQAEIHGLWGYVDRQGDWVIAPRFIEARPFAEGLAAVAWLRSPPLLNTTPHYAWTYLKPDGQLLESEIPNAAWAGDFSQGLAPFRCQDGSFGTVDRRGQLDRNCSHRGVCSFDGKVLIWFTGSYSPDNAPYCVADEEQLPNFDVRLPVSSSYTRVAITGLKSSEYAFAELSPDNRPRVISDTFQHFTGYPDPTYDGGGNGVVIVEHEARGWAVYGVRGQRIVPWQEERIVAFYDDIVIYEVPGTRVDRKASPDEQVAAVCNRRYGARHRTGTELLPPRYPWLNAFSEGLAGACEASPALAAATEGPCRVRLQWCGYIDMQGQHVIELPRAVFDPPEPAAHDRYPHWRSTKTYQLLHHSHGPHAKSDSIPMGVFQQGVASMMGLTSDDERAVGLVNRRGDWVAPPTLATVGEFTLLPDGRWLAPAQMPHVVHHLDFEGNITEQPW